MVPMILGIEIVEIEKARCPSVVIIPLIPVTGLAIRSKTACLLNELSLRRTFDKRCPLIFLTRHIMNFAMFKLRNRFELRWIIEIRPSQRTSRGPLTLALLSHPFAFISQKRGRLKFIQGTTMPKYGRAGARWPIRIAASLAGSCHTENNGIMIVAFPRLVEHGNRDIVHGTSFLNYL